MAQDVKLGQLIDAGQQRDAIHIAVAPVVAAHILAPGEHIGFIGDDRETVGRDGNPLGIVDPFLKAAVKAGDRFFMFLYPNTITSLRHDWAHPAFGASPAPTTVDKAASERWLRQYAEEHYPYMLGGNYGDKPSPEGKEAAFQRLLNDLRTRELYFEGSDLHGYGELDDADELKRHAELYLGTPINWSQFEFSCSC